MKIKMTMILTLTLFLYLILILILIMIRMVRMNSLTLSKMMKTNGNQMIIRVFRLMIHPFPSSNSTYPSIVS